MANRHLSRSVALQSLFEWDFNQDREPMSARQPDDLATIVDRNAAEFAPGLEDTNFVRQLVGGVVKHQKKIDLIITKAAPEWPLSQIAVVDRNILRLGLFELLFEDKKEVPARVAINEAIELAKTFGGETSGKFVNGVLGAVFKEMGEPGKDDIPAKKKRVKDIPYDQMPIEKLGGAVVYRRAVDDQLQLALVHDIFGFWTLSKGHVEANENLEGATVREIKEEMSLDIKIIAPLGTNEYISSDPERGKIRKQVNYFLAVAGANSELRLKQCGGLDDARWFDLAALPDLKMYDDVVPFITKAVKAISQPADQKV